MNMKCCIFVHTLQRGSVNMAAKKIVFRNTVRRMDNLCLQKHGRVGQLLSQTAMRLSCYICQRVKKRMIGQL